MNNDPTPMVALIREAHKLYCHLTDQKLTIGYDRERMWCDLLRQGYTLNQLAQVVKYLQKEIREGRRNIGALKLSNLLQPDRFEEDYNISKAKLYAPSTKTQSSARSPQKLDPKEQERRRQNNLQALRRLRQELDLPPKDPNP